MSESSDKKISVAGTSTGIGLFFPVYGFTVGKVRAEDFKEKGYYVETFPDDSLLCDVRGFTFWDHNNDGLFEDIYATNAEALPEAWEDKYGLSWRLSYNGWVSKFKELGFDIEIHEDPEIKECDGKQELNALITAVSKEKDIAFTLHFAFGNDYGEGATVDSPRSLYCITITTDLGEEY